MLPDHVLYWGLARVPFALTPDPEMLYMSSQHRECLLRLKYAVVSGKGGALLVSENAGDGKTSVLRRLIGDLEREQEGRFRHAFISHPTLEAAEMIGEISRQLGGATPSGGKNEALGALSERLHELYRQGEKVVVVVDEGQMLAHRPDILQELRILLNFCVSDSFLLTFIFSGQAPLEPAVRAMPEFWQRLPVRYFLRNLDAADTADLVHHRMAVAGVERKIFTDDACRLLHRYSQGCPRVICSIADLALVIGHSGRAREVGAQEIQTAATDMEMADRQADGGFHYFHFLGGSAGEEGRQARRRARGLEPAAAEPAAEATGSAPAGATAASAPAARVATPTCPGCQASVQIERGVCARCDRLLVLECRACAALQRLGLAACALCGGELIAGEDRLVAALAPTLAALGVRGAGGRNLPALPRRPGEQVCFTLAPSFKARIARRDDPRLGSAVGRGRLVITTQALAVVFDRSVARLPYAIVNVEPLPEPESLEGCGVRLATETLVHDLWVERSDLSRLAAGLEDWVSGKRKLLASAQTLPGVPA